MNSFQFNTFSCVSENFQGYHLQDASPRNVLICLTLSLFQCYTNSLIPLYTFSTYLVITMWKLLHIVFGSNFVLSLVISFNLKLTTNFCIQTYMFLSEKCLVEVSMDYLLWYVLLFLLFINFWLILKDINFVFRTGLELRRWSLKFDHQNVLLKTWF